MDDLIQALLGLLAAVLTALGAVAVQALRAYADNLIQARLGEGAARVAGQIVAEVMAAPDVQAASQAMVDAGVAAMQKRFPDTAGKMPAETIAGMIAGELGKIGLGVAR
jgi:hypothetical protein